jgi:trehalose 6-phosphate synthase/phosphatase
MLALRIRVRRDDAEAWARRFIDRLAEATAPSRATLHRDRPFPPLSKIRAAFDATGDRRILLDYDGTLVPLARRPQDAKPSREVLDMLRELAALPRTTTAVISGRSRADIEPWLGDIAGLWLAVEHGALLRAPAGDWEPLREGADIAWKARVRPVLEQFAASAPGAYVEEKELSLGWHYRLADAEFGSWLAGTVVATLEDLLAGTELTVLHGNKVIEVRYAWASKGEVAARIVGPGRRRRFVLAVGDYRTDEEMFLRLPRSAVTVRVGPGPTAARFRIADPSAVVGLLGALLDPGTEHHTAA